MPADVFISHSTKDKVVAAQVCSTLEKQGVRCWIAPRDIAGGASWTQEIDSAVMESTVVVLVFSSSALASQATEREIDLAADLDKVIIPLRIETAAFTGGYRLTLSTAQWIDAVARPLHIALEDLVHTVQFHLKGSDSEAHGRSEHEAAIDAPSAGIAVPDLLRKAHAAYLSGDRITAQLLCEQVLGAEPANAEALILAGDIHVDQGRRDEALAEYRRAEQSGAKSRMLQEKIRRL